MTATHTEQEAKFEGTGTFDAQSLRGLPSVSQIREADPEELDAVYYDTADLRLLAHGVTLRRRGGGHDEGWHVKLPAGDARKEIHAPLRAGRGGQVPGELNRWIKAYARGGALVPVAHLHTHRRRHLLLDKSGRVLAEVAQDSVSAQVLGTERLHPDGEGRTPKPAGRTAKATGRNAKPAGGNAKPAGRTGKAAGRQDGATPAPAGNDSAGTSTLVTQWSEIEIEREDGDAGLLRAAARRLEADGWHRSPSAHKLDHALAGALPPGFTDLEPGRRPRAGSAGAVVMDRLAEQLTVLLSLDAGVRADAPDAVHRMRTTSRRLRNLLRSHRRVLDRRRTDPVADELRWLTGALAGARDHEVLAARLPRQAGRLGGPGTEGLADRIAAQEAVRHAKALKSALAELDSPRYHALLDALEDLRADPPLRRKRAAKSAVKHLRKVAAKDRHRLAARIEAAADTKPGPRRDRALHSARKAARRTRHTAESALPYGGKQAAKLRKRTKALQQVLGDHQDAVVARAELTGLAVRGHVAGADTFGYGRLYALQDDLAADARRALPAVWKKAGHRRLVRFTSGKA